MKGTPFAHYMEYLGLRGAVGALRTLSFARAGRVGAWIGRLGYGPFPVRKDVVERQIRAAFPELQESEIRGIARASYENLGRTSIETALLPGFSKQQIVDLFDEVTGWEHVQQPYDNKTGILFVSGHLGNWELGGSLVAAKGIPLHAVTRRMQNPLFDRYLTQTRDDIGMRVIPDSEAVRKAPRAIREGEAVAFLVDQGAAGLASVWVPFFGRLAKTPRGPAVFALRLDVPVVFGCAVRNSNDRYSMHFEPVHVQRTGDREADVDAIVAAYTATLEKWVRKYPEQYFWHHRRWKHQQPGTPAELGDPS